MASTVLLAPPFFEPLATRPAQFEQAIWLTVAIGILAALGVGSAYWSRRRDQRLWSSTFSLGNMSEDSRERAPAIVIVPDLPSRESGSRHRY
jgi:hypothetical protein